MSSPLQGPGSDSTLQGLEAPSPTVAADASACRLSAAIALGDEEAFRELYDRYQDRLFRLARVLAHGNSSLASEVVQSTFVTAAAKLRRVESEAHLWNWLARVTRQQLARVRRQQQNGDVVDVAELPDRAEDCEPDALLEQHLDAALQTMADDDRQLLTWFYFERWSHKEIAEQLHATPKAVSSRLERARSKLRAAMTRTLADES